MAKKKRLSRTSSPSLFSISVLILLVAVTVAFFTLNKKGETQDRNRKQATIENNTPISTQTLVPTPTEQQTQLIIKEPIKDTTPPQVYILSPENNQHIRTPFKIVANITDDVKVDHVDFYAGSSNYQLIGTLRQAPFEIMWTPSAGFGSNYTTNIPIEANAYDTSGNRGYDSKTIYLQY